MAKTLLTIKKVKDPEKIQSEIIGILQGKYKILLKQFKIDMGQMERCPVFLHEAVDCQAYAVIYIKMRVVGAGERALWAIIDTVMNRFISQLHFLKRMIMECAIS